MLENHLEEISSIHQSNEKTKSGKIYIKAPPKDLINAANYDPTVMYHLQMWQNGELSWDAMLLSLVLVLLEQKSELSNGLMKIMNKMPPEAIKKL